MKQTIKTILISGLLSGLVTSGVAAQEPEHNHQHEEKTEKPQQDGHGSSEHEHEDGGHDEGENETTKMSSGQMALANIKVATLERRTMNYQVYAPGEIKANGYTSYRVSPRVDSVVLRRHVALGAHVKKGQELVTLFSESVADSQASYSVARSEWQRVQKLGRKAVGDRRYITAKSEAQAAYGRLLAFGLSEKAIGALSGKSKALGEYTLVAEAAGAVLTDDFHQGQRVESGDALMELADEKELWVEARLAPTLPLKLPSGTKATVKVGTELFSARVSQESHIIDQETRTRVVRLIVANKSHRLHSGMFADVYFSFVTEEPVLAVPEAALMRGGDGDWTVFVEGEPDKFSAQEVELGRSLGKWREITGISAGSRVVVEGAFFVSSQMNKSGFDADHD
ncbi:efflux RND transporter periplasmic adaptor subunit [Paremcibacter congregatus]|uniref:efflux RND transporter periplasmic adaptor subunit n=1 Tax=Paremcibacter congregatus TaxID=2043170 RepID=UPI0030ED05C9